MDKALRFLAKKLAYGVPLRRIDGEFGIIWLLEVIKYDHYKYREYLIIRKS